MTTTSTFRHDNTRLGLDPRWYAVALVTVAIAISYFDRQTLPVAIAAIQRTIPVSNQQFSYLQTAFLLAYAALYALGGRLLDLLGTRRGFLLIMLWWSLACALHGLAGSFTLLLAARFLLAPPLIGVILLRSGWRTVFVAAGAAGLAWVVWWMTTYRSNTQTLSENTLNARTLATRLTFAEIVSLPSVRTLVFAKFMSDSAWYFLLFWLPKYLYDARGFDIKHVSYFAWIPYAASGIGSFLGGWFSSRLLRQGRSLDLARKLALGLSAVFMPVVMFVPLVPVQWAILLFSVAFFFQQSWSGLIMTIPADIFPLSAVGTVSGLVGFGGAIGGAIFGVVAGYLLSHAFGYGTLFVLVGTFHLIGFAAILLFAGPIQPLTPINLRHIETSA